MTRNELMAAVPVHDHKGHPYFVALDEIPEPWREQFKRALHGSGCPVFEGFGQCAFARDWQTWVQGKWLGMSSGPEGLRRGGH